MKTMYRLAAALACAALLCFQCLPALAAGIGTMDPIDWDGYIADPNFIVTGEGDYLNLNENKDAGQLSVTSYLYNLGEENWSWAQMVRAQVTMPDAYRTIFPAGQEYSTTSVRFSDENDKETLTYPSQVAYAEGHFSDFQGQDSDGIPSVHWTLSYRLSVHLISEAWYPSAVFYASGVLPDFTTGEAPTRDEAMARRAALVREGTDVYTTAFGDKPCVVTSTRTEDNSSGTREVFIPGTVIGIYGGGNGTYETIRYTITDYKEINHYYVIDLLPQCPGCYAVIEIETRDSYSDEQSTAKKTFPEAFQQMNQYESYHARLFGGLADLSDVKMTFQWIGQGDFSKLPPPAEQVRPVIQDEIIVTPPEEPGEFQGTAPINKAIIIGSTAAIAAGGALAGGQGGSRRKDEEDGESEEDDSTFRMLLYKNFGNQLKKGEAPKQVGARIVELKKSGQQIPRDDLTERITASSPDGSLTVTGGGMVNGYQTAMVSVPEESGDTEGLLTFTLEGPGGVFTQSVVFLMAEAQIVFAQENMGLPANRLKFAQDDGSEESKFGDGVFRLPFLVKNMGAEGKGELRDLKVTAKLEKDSVTDVNGNAVKADKKLGMPYEVRIVPDKEHKDKGIYEAEIKEVLDYELPAGTTEGVTMIITAELGTPGAKNYEKIEGKFPIFRIHLGLALTLQESSIGCYRQLRKEREGIKQEWMKPSDFEPCFTGGSALLFLYRKKDLSIIRMPVEPEKEVKVTVTRVENDRYSHIGDAGESHQALVDALGISVFPTGELCENGALKLKLCSTKGALDAPTRFLADLEFTFQHKEKKYTIKKEKILLRSQPFRVAENTEQSLQQLKNDQELTDKLDRIKSLVYARHMDHLASLYNLIDRMLDGYDSRFGYDINQVENVYRIWIGYTEGTFAGANADPEPVTLADDLAACYAFMQGLRDNTGFLGRVAMGVMTGGYSEYVFTTMTLAENMRDAVFNCTGDKEFGFWDGVVMGVKEFEKQILLEVAIGGIAKGTNLYIARNTGYDIGAQLGRMGRKYSIAMAKADRWLNKNVAVYKWANNGFKGMKNFYNSSARAMNNAIDDFKQSLDDAFARSKAKVNNAKPNLSPEELKAVREYEDAMANGMEKVRRLQKAQQEMESCTNPKELKAAKERYRDIANEVWTDKNALKQLQRNQHPYAQRMRAQFNQYRETLLDEVQLEALSDIAKETGIPKDQLYVMNASNGIKTDYATGKKVPGDRDISFKQKVLSDRSKDLTINQSTGQNAVARRLYRKMNGRDADTIEEALEFMKGKDVTYVHPEGDSAVNYVFEHNLDGYEDLSGMVGMKVDGTMDKSLLGKGLHNQAINQASVAHKGKEWFHMSKESVSKAAQLETQAAAAAGAEREALLAQAQQLRYFSQGQTVEGVRQITKQVDKIIIPRRCAWYSLDKTGGLPPEFFDIQQIALRVGDDVSPALFEHILKKNYGMDLNTYADYVSKFLE